MGVGWGVMGKALKDFGFFQIKFFLIKWNISPKCKHYSTSENHLYNSHANMSKEKKNHLTIYVGLRQTSIQKNPDLKNKTQHDTVW